MVQRLAFVVATGIAASSVVAAIERDLTDLAITDALAIARSPTESPRRTFHSAYHMPVTQAPVASISVVTEFRRVVLAAEERIRMGDRIWGLVQAREVVRPLRNKLDVVAELNFHPQNAYATIPDFELVLVPKEGPEITPIQLSRTPKYTPLSVTPAEALYYPYPPPTYPVGPGADTMLGAWLVATFDALAFEPDAFLLVVVREGAKDLVRVAIDLSGLR